jgi:hypothetical protein
VLDAGVCRAGGGVFGYWLVGVGFGFVVVFCFWVWVWVVCDGGVWDDWWWGGV